MDMKQFSFQGKLLVAKRDANGDPLAFRNVGVAPTFDVSLSVEVDEKRETESGQRLVYSRLAGAKTCNLSAVLDYFSTKNLALGLYSTPAILPAGSASAEPLPDNLAVGDIVALKQQNVSATALEDSLAAPLTLDTHYRIYSAAHGSLEILDLAAFTQPFAADYSYAGGVNLAIFSQPAPIVWVRLEGINTADGDKPVLVELYKVQFDPFETLSLMNETHGNLSISGAVLHDDTKVADPDLGTFGRVIDLSQPQS